VSGREGGDTQGGRGIAQQHGRPTANWMGGVFVHFWLIANFRTAKCEPEECLALAYLKFLRPGNYGVNR
jgi:hypothetical protein